jgi:DNA-binding FadR family transcriptional regulator
MLNYEFPSELFRYLVKHVKENPGSIQLPSINELSKELGISIARLREQLEVVKALGLVEIRPRTGIKIHPYSFQAAVWQSLSYAIHIDHKYFDMFADLRKHIELTFWEEAVSALTVEDKIELNGLISKAYQKLRGNPIIIPHEEHRELHLLIYKRLENPFVLGILESYWNAYEAIGLSVFADLDYLEEVWKYHREMVEAICNEDYVAGYQALSEHVDLLRIRPTAHVK